MAAKNRVTMNSSRILPIFMGFMLFFLQGCPHPPAPVELPKPVSFEDAITKLHARSGYWKNYQAKLRIRAEGTRGKLRFQAIALANLPGEVRFEAFSLLGQTVALFIHNRDRSSLWIPSEKVIFTAQQPETLIEYFLGVSVSAETLAYSLAGVVPSDRAAGLKPQPVPNGWTIFSGAQEPDRGFTWEFTAQPPALKAIAVKESRGDYRIEYDPPVGLNPQDIPGKIRYQSSQWHMDVSVEQVSPSPGFEASAFTQPVPAGVREVNLDLLK